MKNYIDLRHGDVFEKLKEIEDQSVDCIITSPPYNLKSTNYNDNQATYHVVLIATLQL